MSSREPPSLRIVLVNPYLPPPDGGIEVELLALARQWSDAGHQVHVVATSARFPRGNNRASSAPIPPALGVTRLRGFLRSVLRGFQPSRAPLLVPGLLRAIQSPSPQLVVVWNVGWPLTVRRVLGALRGTPVLYRTYYHPPGGRLRRMKERLLLGTVALADRAVAASQGEREQLLATGLLEPEKVSVVPPGVEQFAADPTALASFRAQHGLEGRRVILHVGRLSRFKGTDHLIQALSRVRERAGDDIVLALVGASNETARLRQLVRQRSVEHAVRWIGELPDQRTLRLAYRSARVFALPSAYESFGFVFLEALSEGVPVIGCASGGVTEAIGDGGLVLPDFGRVDALENALVELLEHQDRARAMGEAGRRRVREQHLWSHTADAFLEMRRLCLSA